MNTETQNTPSATKEKQEYRELDEFLRLVPRWSLWCNPQTKHGYLVVDRPTHWDASVRLLRLHPRQELAANWPAADFLRAIKEGRLVEWRVVV